MLRRLSGMAMAGIGIFLLFTVATSILAYVAHGATLADYFFEPPMGALSFLRPVGALAVISGGIIVAIDRGKGATIALVGAVMICLLGLIMAAAGADIGLWMDEVLYGVGIATIAVLCLTLRRPSNSL